MCILNHKFGHCDVFGSVNIKIIMQYLIKEILDPWSAKIEKDDDETDP
jgi:hypothetical protein